MKSGAISQSGKPACLQHAKVLHLLTGDANGEPQDSVFDLCAYLDHGHYSITVAGNWPERRHRCGQPDGLRVHRLPAWQSGFHPLKDLPAYLQVRALLRRGQFDIVHTHTSKAGFLGRLAARAHPGPVLVHTCPEFSGRKAKIRWPQSWTIALERYASLGTHYFIARNDSARRAGREWGVLDWRRSQTVLPGVDLPWLDRSTNTVAMRQSLGVPDHWATVLLADALAPRKAMAAWVNALGAIVRAQPETCLFVAGEGPGRRAFERELHRNNLDRAVRMLGYRADLPGVISSMDVFGQLSGQCSLPRPLIQAMLLGKPVACPDLPGNHELIQHGESGLLYDAGVGHQFASHVNYLLAHPTERYRLGVNARRVSRRVLDVRQTVRQVEQVYAELLSRQRAANLVELSPPEAVTAQAA